MHIASLKRAYSRAAGALFVGLLCGVALADCPQPPYVQATVKVRSCLAATFEASDSSRDSLDPRSREYKAGAKLSGTLLSVEVIASEVSGGDPRARLHQARMWSKGQSLTLFVSEPPARGCPAVLFGTEIVTSIPDCCDLLPLQGLCLLPESIIRVAVRRDQK
jgi:hypothetical protein